MADDQVILLVENDAHDAAIIEWAFRRLGLGYRLMVVGDGTGAIEYLSGVGWYADRETFPRPRVVLLDLEKPRVSGYEVLEWLRKNRGEPRIPVLVLTGSTDGADMQRAYALGADCCLGKPANGDVLVQELRQALTYWDWQV